MSIDIQSLEKQLSLGPGARIVMAHPSGLIALEKPDTLLSHPNKSTDKHRSLIRGEYDPKERRYHELEDAGSLDEVYLIHRLDSATSGVILVCTEKEMVPQLIRAFDRGMVQKTYNAIVRGRPAGLPRQWTDMLQRKNERGQRGVRMVQAASGDIARTEQRILRTDANQLGLSLMWLRPITGRTHQLRVQCMRRGHPILGDANYGDFEFNRHFNSLPYARRLFLHALSIELPILYNGKREVFKATASLPEAFEKMIGINKEARALSQYAPKKDNIVSSQRRKYGRVVPYN